MPLSDEQRAGRAGILGASEVPALFNASPHLSRWELWQRKAGNLPDEHDAGLPAMWGDLLEPVIAKGIARDQGWRIRKVKRHIPHPTVQRFGASLDYEACDPDVDYKHGWPAALEIKNVDRFVYARWPDGAPPLHFQLQVQAQLACAVGKERSYLGVLIGGNTPLVLTYWRHPGAIGKIEREVAAFWQSIDADEPPDIDFERDYQAVAQLYNNAAPDSIRDFRGDHQLAALCAEYAIAQKAEKASVTAKGALKARILEHIRDTETAIADGFKVCASEIPPCTIETYQRESYRSFRVIQIGGKEES